MDNKEVSWAKLHEVVHTPGTGSFGPTLSDSGDFKTSGLKMYLQEDGWLRIEIKNQKILVPQTMITHLMLKPN